MITFKAQGELGLTSGANEQQKNKTDDIQEQILPFLIIYNLSFMYL